LGERRQGQKKRKKEMIQVFLVGGMRMGEWREARVFPEGRTSWKAFTG
jgi:hypothetical protein